MPRVTDHEARQDRPRSSPWAWLCGRCGKLSTLRGSKVLVYRGARVKHGPCCAALGTRRH